MKMIRNNTIICPKGPFLALFEHYPFIQQIIGCPMREIGPVAYKYYPNQIRYSSRFRQAKSLDDNSKAFSSKIEESLSLLRGMITRKSARPLIGFIKTSLSFGRLTRSRCALIVLFCRLCHLRWKTEKWKGLVL